MTHLRAGQGRCRGAAGWLAGVASNGRDPSPLCTRRSPAGRLLPGWVGALAVAVVCGGRFAAAEPPVAEPGKVLSAEEGSGQTADQPPAAGRSAVGEPPPRPSADRYLPPRTRGVLPSDGERGGPDQPVAPHVILREFELTPEVLEPVADELFAGQDEGSSALLLRLLYRFGRIPRLNVQHAARALDDLHQLVREGAAYRLRAFSIRGRVVMARKIEVADSLASRLEIPHFFRCDAWVGSPEVPAVIYALEVPARWDLTEALDETISFQGLFVQRGPGAAEVAPLMFITRRLAWHANTVLGDLGMDIGLLDGLRQKRPLEAREQECFYQMLASVQLAGSAELLRRAYNDVVYQTRELMKAQRTLQQQEEELTAKLRQKQAAEPQQLARQIDSLDRQQRRLQLRIDHANKQRAHEFFPLLHDPSSHVGTLKMYRGTAHRIVPVRIQDREIVQRFGIRKYYQIDMMVKLEGKLKIIKAHADKGAAGEEEVDRVTWTHPATVCVLELPEGMPTGDNVHEDLRVAGFFLKHWAFETEQLADGQPRRRYAPLLIGRRPIWEREPPADANLVAGVIAGGLFIVALIGVWVGVWYMNRTDRKFEKAVVAKVQAAYGPVSLNDLNLQANDAVDFRHLETSPADDPPADDPSADES
ncbi:MAG: hypothetical protein GTO53_14660 [Planctomycetales bacterium]|nr:hypothetical protein [Planctomycetales bacterium]NIM10324.1 hypothetical protein [Planctomycetales bacterium]NIN78894.1 hypothetical protein [Planctomycetales bacterium]NIO36065.1 hypothetical protein [Planctomycetales bacterium]NIO47806.1 hypothetical protein [Planctomycetales bacterium]